MTITLSPEQAMYLRRIELEQDGQGPYDAEDCMCLMEAVAVLAGEPRTPHPACADPTITYLGIAINDTAEYAERQELKPLVPFIIGTAGDELDVHRLGFALRWAATDLVPELIGRLGYWERAEGLEALKTTLPLAPGAAWHPVLGLLEQARMTVRHHVETGDWTALRDREQEQINVQNMIGRIISALTDWVDPEFTPGEVPAIAAALSGLFTVPLRYNWGPLQPKLVRFLTELVHTGRSYI